VSRPVFLQSIQHVLGDRNELGSLSAAIGGDVVAALRSDGMQYYRVSGHSRSELAFQALAQALEQSSIRAEAIDLLIVCSLAGLEDDATIAERCVALGLTNAQLLGLALADCTNLSAAMHLGATMIAAGEVNAVAIVSSDLARSPEERLTQLGAGILSDGAAAVILSAQSCEGWRHLATASVADQRLRAMHARMNYPRLLALSARRIRETVCGALTRARVDMDALECVVMTNLKASANAFVVRQSGAPVERLYTGSLADMAHVFAADPFINLAAVSSEVAPGTPVLMIALSPYCWNATVLERSV
jgi:3-oxoacyl-[acyl-carrier-protein] synthase III